MSLAVTCDHCKKPITEVVYAVAVLDAQRIDISPTIGRAHLHWDCLPLWGRSTEKAGS